MPDPPDALPTCADLLPELRIEILRVESYTWTLAAGWSSIRPVR